MSQPESLSGQTALVTGASSGIGLAIARQLADRGCHLILLSRSKGGVETLEQWAREAAVEADVDWRECDVTRRESVAQTVADLQRDHARVDLLINNAGIARGAPDAFWDQPLDEIHQMLATNIGGVCNVTHAVLNAFLIPQNTGTIVNISSITGLEVPEKGMGEVIYHASKSFMEAFTNALRNEALGTRLRVLAVRPGFVRTKFHYDRAGQDSAAYEAVFEGLEELVAEDIADAAVWMAEQPERISVKALDIVPTAQRSLAAVDREWNARKGKA